MITPIKFEIRCAAWDCNPDRYPYARVMSKPLVVDARSRREAAAQACKAGWRRTPGQGMDFWCPTHAAIGCKPS
ncbi:hypothetical protein [Mycolicibacterium senegalense]|uniref:Uncharacterized protein n=1 Tax=Mycolicibacterium senegalense TaxID=1796 RepID=A0ABR5G1P0_9MYCO|nr:hypothetical protein [Mycolicibacterium senegalense]KLI05770.1 hypothetical protein AA982_22675 [Mycolicibacterium senegalense]KLO54054.1 hypothetical protein ABW05_23845 [Mycolicibacterium senegalense]KLO54120.1 hypothetical protein ABW05_24285 [Mycolicibacterium senegalense]